MSSSRFGRRPQGIKLELGPRASSKLLRRAQEQGPASALWKCLPAPIPSSAGASHLRCLHIPPKARQIRPLANRSRSTARRRKHPAIEVLEKVAPPEQSRRVAKPLLNANPLGYAMTEPTSSSSDATERRHPRSELDGDAPPPTPPPPPPPPPGVHKRGNTTLRRRDPRCIS